MELFAPVGVVGLASGEATVSPVPLAVPSVGDVEKWEMCGSVGSMTRSVLSIPGVDGESDMARLWLLSRRFVERSRWLTHIALRLASADVPESCDHLLAEADDWPVA